jgi:hypothetical protein
MDSLGGKSVRGGHFSHEDFVEVTDCQSASFCLFIRCQLLLLSSSRVTSCLEASRLAGVPGREESDADGFAESSLSLLLFEEPEKETLWPGPVDVCIVSFGLGQMTLFSARGVELRDLASIVQMQ